MSSNVKIASGTGALRCFPVVPPLHTRRDHLLSLVAVMVAVVLVILLFVVTVSVHAPAVHTSRRPPMEMEVFPAVATGTTAAIRTALPFFTGGSANVLTLWELQTHPVIAVPLFARPAGAATTVVAADPVLAIRETFTDPL